MFLRALKPKLQRISVASKRNKEQCFTYLPQHWRAIYRPAFQPSSIRVGASFFLGVADPMKCQSADSVILLAQESHLCGDARKENVFPRKWASKYGNPSTIFRCESSPTRHIFARPNLVVAPTSWESCGGSTASGKNFACFLGTSLAGC
jgi:hypothetical protein